jgi:flagellar protein FlgJ
LAELIEKQLTRHMAPGEASGQDASTENAGVSRPGAASAAPGWAEGRVRVGGRPPPMWREASGQPSVSLAPEAAEALKAALSKRLDGPQAAFVEKMWPHALAAQRSTGVPAAFAVGQAALESGWGKHELRHADGRSAHNLFGIKAGGGWNGPTVDVLTTEYVDGKPTKLVERFRAYGSYAEAFSDWAGLLGSQSRYQSVLRAADSVQGFAHGMQRAGYATDPRYGEKLERTINQTLLLRRLVI